MKKSALFISLLSISSVAFCMQYYPGKYGAPDGERDLKWTTCIWGNNVNFETEPLPGKPGANDSVTVRPGPYNFEVDGNFNVLSFHTGDAAHSFAKNRTLKTKKQFAISIPCSNAGVTRQDWDNCNLETNGAYNVTFWHEATQAGRAVITFIDTKFVAKGEFICIIPASPRIVNEVRAGIEIVCEGGSDVVFTGGAVMDSLFEDQNDNWMFKWTFKEKDGKAPHVFFQRRAQFKKADIEVSVSDKIKSGVYGLIEFQDKKSGLDSPRSITLNGEDYKLGTEFKLGKRTAKLSIAPFGRDKSTPNDLVLEVSK